MGVTIEARREARATLERWIREYGSIARAAAADPGAEVLRGRGLVYVVSAGAEGRRWAVRHYLRGGSVARVLGDRYLRLGEPRPIREYRLSLAVEGLGIDTPRVIGAAVYRAGPFYRGDLVTEFVPRSADLAAVLFGRDALPGSRTAAAGAGASAPDASDREGAMAAAGSLVGRLHARGVVHRDLNLKNILLAPGDGAGARALILDLDAGRILDSVPEKLRQSMLRRFWRSAAKWEERTGRRLEPALRTAFEAAYTAAAASAAPGRG